MAKKDLEVVLISIPDNLLDVIYTACRTCYSADGAVEIYNNITMYITGSSPEETANKVVQKQNDITTASQRNGEAFS